MQDGGYDLERFDFELWKKGYSKKFPSIVSKYLKKTMKPKFYTEYVGVNLMKFINLVAQESEEFYLRGDRLTKDMYPYL